MEAIITRIEYALKFKSQIINLAKGIGLLIGGFFTLIMTFIYLFDDSPLTFPDSSSLLMIVLPMPLLFLTGLIEGFNRSLLDKKEREKFHQYILLESNFIKQMKDDGFVLKEGDYPTDLLGTSPFFEKKMDTWKIRVSRLYDYPKVSIYFNSDTKLEVRKLMKKYRFIIDYHVKKNTSGFNRKFSIGIEKEKLTLEIISSEVEYLKMALAEENIANIS